MLMNYFKGLPVNLRFVFEKTQHWFISEIYQMLAKVCVFHMIILNIPYSRVKPRGLLDQFVIQSKNCSQSLNYHPISEIFCFKVSKIICWSLETGNWPSETTINRNCCSNRENSKMEERGKKVVIYEFK